MDGLTQNCMEGVKVLQLGFSLIFFIRIYHVKKLTIQYLLNNDFFVKSVFKTLDAEHGKGTSDL